MLANEGEAAPTAPFSAGTTDGFVLLSLYGGQGNSDGNDTTITGSIGGGAWAVASTKPSLNETWTAHGGISFGRGTYTIDATPDDTTDALTYTFTVGTEQVGGHILWDWGLSTNIDIVNVWDVTGNTYTSVDWDQDGRNTYYDTAVVYPGEPNVRGDAMIDGPFPGFSANFAFTVVPKPASLVLVVSSLVGLVGLRRRQERQSS
jgi:hypothetical protein